MSIGFKILKHIAKVALKKNTTQFQNALTFPRVTQLNTLAMILRSHTSNSYAQKYDLKSTDNYESFIKKVPIVTYENLSAELGLQKKNNEKLISSESVHIYEKTSGSSGPTKYIPYTAGLLSSFHNMFYIWANDLLVNGPNFLTGKTFFSISQPFQRNETSSFKSDLDYLSPFIRLFFGSYFINPPGLAQLQNHDSFKRCLSAAMVAETDLEIISIWSPTYLTTLLDYIQENRECLIRDLLKGQISVENKLFKFKVLSAERQALLEKNQIPWDRLWPNLNLISVWTDGSSEFFAQRLYRDFPNTLVQGKGLLATEAPMTVPLIHSPAPLPLLQDVFFEFEDSKGNINLIDELELEQQYSLIISQKSGFLRYRIGDFVKVEGFLKATPCLKFIGRDSETSDMVGEKLSSGFVVPALQKLFADTDHFTFLVPIPCEKPFYCCFTDMKTSDSVSLQEDFDRLLSKSYHYNQSRRLQQLHSVQIHTKENLKELYYSYLMTQGMKWGDIKYSPIVKNQAVAEFLLSNN